MRVLFVHPHAAHGGTRHGQAKACGVHSVPCNLHTHLPAEHLDSLLTPEQRLRMEALKKEAQQLGGGGQQPQHQEQQPGGVGESEEGAEPRGLG